MPELLNIYHSFIEIKISFMMHSEQQKIIKQTVIWNEHLDSGYCIIKYMFHVRSLIDVKVINYSLKSTFAELCSRHRPGRHKLTWSFRTTLLRYIFLKYSVKIVLFGTLWPGEIKYLTSNTNKITELIRITVSKQKIPSC